MDLSEVKMAHLTIKMAHLTIKIAEFDYTKYLAIYKISIYYNYHNPLCIKKPVKN